jgi:hypothetical protein
MEMIHHHKLEPFCQKNQVIELQLVQIEGNYVLLDPESD